MVGLVGEGNGGKVPQLVLIIVTQLLEQRRRRLHARRLIVCDPVHAQMVLHDVGDGLSVGGGARAAAPDCVVDLGQFVRDAVGDVGAGGGARVGAKDDTVGEVDGHAVRWVRGLEGLKVVGRLVGMWGGEG